MRRNNWKQRKERDGQRTPASEVLFWAKQLPSGWKSRNGAKLAGWDILCSPCKLVFPVQGHQYEGTGWAARVQSITTRAGCGWSNPTKGACTKQISVLRYVLRELQPHVSNCALSLPAQPGVVFPLIINKQCVLGLQVLQQTNTEDKIALTLQYLFPKPPKPAISYNYLPVHSVVQLPRTPANAARCCKRCIKSWSPVSPTHMSHSILQSDLQLNAEYSWGFGSCFSLSQRLLSAFWILQHQNPLPI